MYGSQELRNLMIEQGHVDNLQLKGLSSERKPVFAGGVAVLLLLFELVMGVVAVLLYGLDVSSWSWMFVVMPLTAIGLAELGTISGAIAASVQAGPALVPLLVTPLAIPLLLGATQTVESIGREGGNLSWLLLMLIVVLVLAIVGVLTARPLQETR